MSLDVEKVITDKAEETRTKFRSLLDKTSKEHPSPKDVKALSDLPGLYPLQIKCTGSTLALDRHLK